MNARFANKALLRSNLNELNALINYFENGGTITVVPASKRSAAKGAPSINALNARKAKAK